MARNAGETEWWCTQSRAQSGRLSRLIRLKSCGREWHCWSRLASLHACGLEESNVWHRLAGSNSNPGKSKPPNPRCGCHDANPLASWAASWGAFPKAYPKSQGKKDNPVPDWPITARQRTVGPGARGFPRLSRDARRWSGSWLAGKERCGCICARYAVTTRCLGITFWSASLTLHGRLFSARPTSSPFTLVAPVSSKETEAPSLHCKHFAH